MTHISNKLTAEENRLLKNLTDYTGIPIFGQFGVRIMALDNRLSEVDPDYDAENATYKGEEVSMKEYITTKFGEPTAKLLEKLMRL